MSCLSTLRHEVINYISVISSEIQTIETIHTFLPEDPDWKGLKTELFMLTDLVKNFPSDPALPLSAESAASMEPLCLSSSVLTKQKPDETIMAAQHGTEYENVIFSLHALLQTLSHSWKFRYNKKGFRLTYINQHQEESKMKGIPYEIVQIFNNLLSNSYNALAEKQKNPPEHEKWFPEVSLILSGFKDQFVIRIHDNGNGIPEQKLPHVFDYGMTTGKKGHGIGLSVAKKLVQKHHGHIYVHSERNTECNFFVIFPIESSGTEYSGPECTDDPDRDPFLSF